MITKRALICQTRVPEAEQDRGSGRILELIEFLQSDGWAVTFIAQQAGASRRAIRRLQQRGVAAYAGFDSETEAIIAAGQFQVAVLAFWHVAEPILPILYKASPQTRIIVDSIDVHFLRSARRLFRQAGAGGAGGMLDAAYGSEMVRELNTYAAADAVLAVSQKEADLINDLVGRPGLAHVVPLSENLPRSTVSFAERRGILFLGNFRHLPNIEAAQYLCREVVPRLDAALLAEHPLYIVGHALTDAVREAAAGLPHVKVVGWVPSTLPYFQRARVSVVPLLHGAGVKGKLIQALMLGTPTVATPIGTEGLSVRHGEHVLVADDPDAFAASITRLLQDEALWQRLAEAGCAQVQAEHSRDAARQRFLDVLNSVVRRPPAAPWAAPFIASHGPRLNERYRQEVAHVREVVSARVPQGATVLVVSKGDDDLLRLDGRPGWHFPQTETGQYAGHHPADSKEALAHLEALRARGGQYLLFPPSAAWWLDYYHVFKHHLDSRYRRLTPPGDDCVLYALAEPADTAPVVTHQVLVVGHQPALLDSPELAEPARFVVTERWLPPGGEGGWAGLNALLAAEDLSRYDYVVIAAEPVRWPARFVDDFIALQAELGWAVAQPAVHIGAGPPYPVLEQLQGAAARQTCAVALRPVVSVHRSAYSVVFPLGQGGEAVLAAAPAGIIDQFPVEPLASARQPQPDPAVAQRLRVVDVFDRDAGRLRSRRQGGSVGRPRLSVVIATYNRADLLRACLESFERQSLPRDDFEVVVVDDGSTDATSEVCQRFLARLPLVVFRIGHAGRSAAKNLGLFAARSEVVLFFDDDDAAGPDLLRQHLETHRQHPQPHVAVLGYTAWAPHLDVTPLMEHVTDIDQFLFAYPKLKDGQVLDWRHFWEGRLSVKRDFLLQHGAHDQRLAYTIDIELGYRLSQFGLRVIFNRAAVSYMLRPITFEQFCRRCEDKGHAQYRFSRLHPSPEIQAYCDVIDAEAKWASMQPAFESKVARVHALEASLQSPSINGDRAAVLDELRAHYRWTFTAYRLKGIAEAAAADRQPARAQPEPSGAPLFSIIVPAWNVNPELAEMTARHLERIWQVRQVETEVILIDNASPCQAPYQATTCVRWDENRGIAAGWNAGAALANGQVLCFLNTDVWVEPGWDRGLVEAALDGQRIAFPYTDHDDGQGPRAPDKAGTAGWCFALSRAVWEQVGQFDETFSPAFFEDTDYFHRAWQAGVELSPVPGAVVKHSRRTTAQHQPRVDWLFQAHRLKYGWKHGVDPTAPPPFYLREVVDYRPAQSAGAAGD